MIRANESGDGGDLPRRRAAVERLPSVLDEAGTAPWAMAQAVGLSRNELSDRLVDVTGQVLSPGEGRRPVMAFLERFGSLDSRRRGLRTAAELAGWLAGETGVAPSLFSGLWLTPVSEDADLPHDLRLDLAEDGRSLLVIWELEGEGESEGPPATDREDLLRFCPPGTRIQLARIRPPLPGNLYVRGLYLKGELLASWA